MADPFEQLRKQPEKWAALGRLEGMGCVGQYDSETIHVQLRLSHGQSSFDEGRLPQAVHDINVVGNVAIVDLREAALGDTALPQLKLLRDLKELWLTGTHLSAEAVEELKLSLPKTIVAFEPDDED